MLWIYQINFTYNCFCHVNDMMYICNIYLFIHPVIADLVQKLNCFGTRFVSLNTLSTLFMRHLKKRLMSKRKLDSCAFLKLDEYQLCILISEIYEFVS